MRAVSGVNLPLLAYADLTGGARPRSAGYRTGVRWLSFGNDLRAFVRDYRKSGALTFSEWVASYRGPLVHDVFSWTDPVPFVAGMAAYARAAFGRLRRARSMDPAGA